MKSVLRLVIVSAVFLAAWSLPASAQDQVHIISIYHVAPGQQVAFLQWAANQEAASRDAGVPVGQWYVHMDGDSWDYLGIALDTTEEQDAAIDAAAEARGMKTGMPAGIELRKYITSHTDTYAAGPMTASELLATAQGN